MEDLVELTNFWIDRPVFITGATGLVGGWLVKRLIASGADVICLVRDWVPQAELNRMELFNKIKVVRGDIRDQVVLERALGEYDIRTVIHLAAQTIVTIANRNPISTFESNITGTWTLLEACRRSPMVEQIVVASSDKAYGDQQVLPYREDAPLRGCHPYDVSKSCADLIAHSYAVTYKLPVVITRCGNFYGGGDLNWNRIIPGTIRSVLRGTPPVIRSDGSLIRDYFYVEDGAAVYMLLVEKLAADPMLGGESFNFSNELPISVHDLVQVILSKMSSKLRPVILDKVNNEIGQQYLSSEKARNMLGWKPFFSLDQGLDLTIDWYKNLLGENY